MATSPTPGLSSRLILLFSVTAGASVGNLYWAQPLLALIAESFGMPTHEAGLVVTLTQVGYALGVFLIVPLGNVLNRQRLVPIEMASASLALIGCAVAPSFWMLLTMSLLVGLSTIGGQIITPLAGDMAADHQRGKVLGLVISGLGNFDRSSPEWHHRRLLRVAFGLLCRRRANAYPRALTLSSTTILTTQRKALLRRSIALCDTSSHDGRAYSSLHVDGRFTNGRFYAFLDGAHLFALGATVFL